MAGLDSNTKLLLHFDGADAAQATSDSSESGHSITFDNQAELDTAEKKWGTASLLLDGTGDSVHAGDSADWNIVAPTGNITVDFWVKHDDHAGDEMYFSQYTGATDFIYFYNSHGNYLRFWVYDGGATVIQVDGTEISDTDWHHIALIRVVDDWQIYVDGAANGNAQDENHTVDNGGDLYLGGVTGGSYSFDGHIDEFRVQHSNYFGADPTNGSDTITVPVRAYSAIDVRGGMGIGHGPHIY